MFTQLIEGKDPLPNDVAIAKYIEEAVSTWHAADGKNRFRLGIENGQRELFRIVTCDTWASFVRVRIGLRDFELCDTFVVGERTVRGFDAILSPMPLYSHLDGDRLAVRTGA